MTYMYVCGGMFCNKPHRPGLKALIYFQKKRLNLRGEGQVLWFEACHRNFLSFGQAL